MWLNLLLMFLTIGWTINASVFQARDQWGVFQFWLNALLAVSAGLILTYRLS